MIYRKITPSHDISCALYLYFLGLSTKSVAKKALSFLNIKVMLNLEKDSKTLIYLIRYSILRAVDREVWVC